LVASTSQLTNSRENLSQPHCPTEGGWKGTTREEKGSRKTRNFVPLNGKKVKRDENQGNYRERKGT